LKPSIDQNSLTDLVADLEEEAALVMVMQRIQAGDDPMQIIAECNAGMRLVGLRYESGDYFLSGLIMAGEIFRKVMEVVQPRMEEQGQGRVHGRVLLGTVAGDIHDIGKNIIGMLLACHGFSVVDLGVDVAPQVFGEKVAEIKPDIVGLSGLLSASHETMKKTVSTLREKARVSQVTFPIVIGGGMVDEQVCRYVDADHWAPDAMSGVRLCQDLMDGINRNLKLNG
jgi:methylmalonyl-CoA mutase cobalamin-binding domain/chain